MNPQFINPDGYDLEPNLAATIIEGKQMYNFIPDPTAPVTFNDGNHLLYIDCAFKTDLGTIPQPLQAIPGLSKDDYEISYCFHDKNCRSGGLLTAQGFRAYTRAQADALLRQMVRVEATLKQRPIAKRMAPWAVWLGVRIGAMFGIGSSHS